MTDKSEKLLEILKEGLAPALGCTEPIALAYSTATAAQKLKGELKNIKIRVNRNIYKNGLRVGIPGTDKTGLYFAAALGYLCGDPAKELEVIEGVNEENIKEAEKILEEEKIEINIADNVERLFIETVISTDEGQARAITLDKHLNIIEVEKRDYFSGYQIPEKEVKEKELDIKDYNLGDIFRFADNVELEKLEILEKGIELSNQIIERGRKKGSKLGASLQKMIEQGIASDNMMNRAQLLAAIASEARMTGCKSPVMSNSGSGNQGLTAFVTIMGAAEVQKIKREKLLRSLVVSNLVSIYIKSYLGVLSAMCGAAVAAGTGASAGIVYMMEGNAEDAYHAALNMIGVLTGIICDGAKDGCAYKVALSARWAVRSALLALDGVYIPGNNGILDDNFRDLIKNMARVNNLGMRKTDQTIMEIMLENERKL